ncbi:MAG: lactate permease LctP family transporter [Deferrisomatales bacterium]
MFVEGLPFALTYALAWSPVVLVVALALGLRRPALDLSVAALVYTFGLCLWGFGTPARVLVAAGADGVLTTLPLLLVIAAGVGLSTVCLAKGALQRIVTWYSGRVAGPWHRTALLTMGLGNFMEGAGVIAEPVLAPMIRASGLSPTSSAALSIVGYSGLMTLALAGIIVTVLAAVTGLPSATLGAHVAAFSVLPTLLLSLSVPWLVEGWGAARRQARLFAAAGLTAALGAWATAHWVGVPVSAMFGGLAVVALLVLPGWRGITLDRSILRDFAPFLLIIAGLSAVSLHPALRQATRSAVTWAVTVVPGHPIALRPLFDAYTYLFAALALALVLFPYAPGERGRLLRASLAKAWRPVVAMALFGAVGQMIAYSGYAPGFTGVEASRNLASILAQGTYRYTGSLYPVFAPLLGWVGTFLTGYGVASIMLFGKFQLAAADLLGLDPSVLASALAIGASVGSVSSPFKIAIATPLCGAAGQEGEILRRTVPLGVAVSLALGLWVWAWG